MVDNIEIHDVDFRIENSTIYVTSSSQMIDRPLSGLGGLWQTIRPHVAPVVGVAPVLAPETPVATDQRDKSKFRMEPDVEIVQALQVGPKLEELLLLPKDLSRFGGDVLLRIRVWTDERIWALPFEFASGPKTDRLVTLDGVSLVRAVESETPHPFTSDASRITFLCSFTPDAGTRTRAAVSFDETIRAIRAKVDNSARRSTVAIDLGEVRDSTWDGLRNELDAIDGDIVLIMGGHGRLNDKQSFELSFRPNDGSGGLHWVSAEDIAEAIDPARVRCVLICACHSAGGSGLANANLAVRLARKGVPAVIGMSTLAHVDAAKAFVASFVGALLEDDTVDGAVRQGRAVISLTSNRWQYGVPRLVIPANPNLTEPIPAEHARLLPTPHITQLNNVVGESEFSRVRTIGRDDEIAKVASLLHQPGRKLAVISGAPGIGKSELAYRVFREYAFQVDFAWWVNAESRNSILAGLSDLAARVNATSAGTEDATADTPDQGDDTPIVGGAERARTWLNETDRSWLLVFDNAEPAIGDEAAEVLQWLPTSGNGLVVVTSRDDKLVRNALPVELKPLRRNDAVELFIDASERFERPVKQSDVDLITKIVDAMGRLPLAVIQVANSFRDRESSLARFWEYVESGDVLHGSKLQWLLTDALKRLEDDEQRLLAAMTYLDVTAIPRSIIDSRATASVLDMPDIDFALRRFRRLGLIDAPHANGPIRMHRLVAEIVRDLVATGIPSDTGDAGT